MSEFFLSENFQFLMVKLSIYLNRRVFVMYSIYLNRRVFVMRHIVVKSDRVWYNVDVDENGCINMN